MEGIVGAPVVNVVAETGDEEGQCLHVLQGRELVTILEENVAEVGYREGVVPVVVRRVTVALFHHQQKSVADVCIDQSGLNTGLSYEHPSKLYVYYCSLTNIPVNYIFTEQYLASVSFCSFHLLISPKSSAMLIMAWEGGAEGRKNR